MPRTLAGGNGPTDWNEALDIISFGSPEQVSNLPCLMFIWCSFLEQFLFTCAEYQYSGLCRGFSSPIKIKKKSHMYSLVHYNS